MSKEGQSGTKSVFQLHHGDGAVQFCSVEELVKIHYRWGSWCWWCDTGLVGSKKVRVWRNKGWLCGVVAETY